MSDLVRRHWYGWFIRVQSTFHLRQTVISKPSRMAGQGFIFYAMLEHKIFPMGIPVRAAGCKRGVGQILGMVAYEA